MPENPFLAADAGEQYRAGRPYHHPRSLAHAWQYVDDAHVERALDVACGTGMSTRALRAYADAVLGVDVSPVMLRVARDADDLTVLLGRAETLPFPTASIDLVTCCSGVHWFDQAAFFDELRRVLRGRGWVVCYDHYFVGEMLGVPEFGDWAREVMERFPLPERNHQVGDPRATVPNGFVKVVDDFFTDDIEMTPDTFADYQLSISNFVKAVDDGAARGDLRDWLLRSTAPLFGDAPTRAVRFLGSISVLRVA